ncbi:Hypothetical Protein FCC1311_103712 [Hondaea fermentalgiana]|uniref:Uncharacterized protein n=1 Tax=Hondaea fermentalgiana TaxID=2315210 RepID=A0A2R5GTF1_9STRA|nr:Hypothetical Protein FCC1311_103712 [Hondaea fermentalgiana]|eukprot:GBG34147.1 Hypothetical Protein FCC1311_103712 [Hondaea fermentalgiana]
MRAKDFCEDVHKAVRALLYGEGPPTPPLASSGGEGAALAKETHILNIKAEEGLLSMALCQAIDELASLEVSRENSSRALALLELAIEIAGGNKEAGSEAREKLGEKLDGLREKIRSAEDNPDEMATWAKNLASSAGAPAPDDIGKTISKLVNGRWSMLAHIMQVVPGADGEPLQSAQLGRNAKRKVKVAGNVLQSRFQDQLNLSEDVTLALRQNLPLPAVVSKSFGSERAIFTAPHGTYVVRKEGELHLAENYASFVAEGLARLCEGEFIGWSPAEIFRSQESKLPHLQAYDPNFTPLGAEKPEGFHGVLNNALSQWSKTSKDEQVLHFDCHGRKNWKVGEAQGAVTVGMGALERYARSVSNFRLTEAEIIEAKTTIVHAIQAGLGSNWVVDANPKYAGAGGDSYRTMTRMSVDALDGEILAVQLEMSREFRIALVLDSGLMQRFASSLKSIRL